MTERIADLVLERVGEGYLALDADGTVLDANDVASSLLGADGSIAGRDVASLPDWIGEYVSGGIPDGGTAGEVAVRVEGEERFVEVETIPADGEEDVERVVLLRDVTERTTYGRYERIVEAMGDGVYVLDEEGRYVALNDAAVEMIGRDREELLGTEAGAGYDEADRERFVSAIGELLAEDGEGVRTVGASYRHPDGEEIYIEVTLTVLTTEGGEFRGTVGVVRDDTERREREEELQRYETLLDLMPDTVLVTDTEGRHVELHGHRGWTGYDTDELIGEPISVTTPEEDVERANEAAGKLFRNDDLEKVIYEQEIVTKDGEHVPVENHLTLLPPDEDGTIHGSMSVLRDITDRKERERELARQNERLEQFASVVSHDLRNPLNVAHARVKNALKGVDAEGLESADEALSRMNGLIEDLLALAREGQAVGEMEAVSLRGVAHDSWESVEAPDATLAVEGDATFQADPSRLEELFGNLFRNCIEHVGTTVSIRVGSIGGEDAPVEGFYVEDDGPGVPPEEREEIFERGVTRSEDGTGFGLAIVREIAEAHGWSAEATEGSDGGARFEFSLAGASDQDGA